ncbi:hypothetical protein [Streptomyces subrutilus]|nr:hypothetical protein [Streptomyces subrutilus]QEU80011.1 hypothetical protein CP968_18340 [Streptomyces subrutilus]WSJ30724.1 hypothetical protein OG479_16265 [Streptomyces subrutilus]
MRAVEAPETAVAPETTAAPEVPGRRHRGRTALLIAAAAALGVLAGTATGYAVQYDRPPTPLPPLAQPSMTAPKPLARDEASSTRSVNANRWHKSDEDLATMLIEAPGGAKTAFSGSLSPDAYAADFYNHPGAGLRSLLRDDVRRIASVKWAEDDQNFVDVYLLQFRTRGGADSFQRGQSSYMPDKDHAGNDGMAVPGVPAAFGRAWVDSEQHAKPGYLPVRDARALLRRGDILIDIHYTNNRGKVDKNAVLDLAKRQMERL